MKKIAIVRGKFLNKYELQFYEPLVKHYKMLGVGSLTCFEDKFSFPVVKLPSPVDLPDFPHKMPILNRLFIDANYLVGLERVLDGYDIAHSAESYYHFTIQCLNAKKKGKIKAVVVSVFENIVHAGEGIWGRKNFKQRTYREADKVIAVSQKTKDALIAEGCSEDKISIINQHINTDIFRPAPSKKEKFTTILFCGRIETYKGIFDFVQSANLLLKDKKLNSSLRFLVVGKGSKEREIYDLEIKLGINKFFTHKYLPYDKIPKVYQQSDIFIAPSRTTRHWQEQFSTVLLEAKSSGLAIISTDTGGIGENVGSAGILVKEGNIKNLVYQTKRLILNKNLRRKLGNAARHDALERFTIKAGAEKLRAVYESTKLGRIR